MDILRSQEEILQTIKCFNSNNLKNEKRKKEFEDSQNVEMAGLCENKINENNIKISILKWVLND